MKPQRQIWTRGSVVRIPLGDGSYAFAQMLEMPEYAFFYLKSSEVIDSVEVIRHPVLFRLWATVNIADIL
jgi:hypothetical protein